MIDITPIIEALIALCAALITAFLIPWLVRRCGAEKADKIARWVNIAVNAAEQIYSAANSGREKKDYVLDFLSKMGLIYDTEQINALIEAEVLKLNEKEKNRV